MRRPLLLLPRPLDEFVLGDHARELVETAGGAVALPGRLPYGALLRAPRPLRAGIGRAIGRRLARTIPRDWAPDQTVLIAYHAIQWPAAHAMLERGVASELWYCRWDRYEAAHNADDAHHQLAEWHAAMAQASSLTFAVSERLAELEREAGREAIVVGLSADRFPDKPLLPGGRGAELIAAAIGRAGLPVTAAIAETTDAPLPIAAATPAAAAVTTVGRGDASSGSATPAPVAVSLGHLGQRTDWLLLRGLVERLPDLQLLLIGTWHEAESGKDDDYRWLRSCAQVVWLGRLSDENAAAVIAQADVGIIPFAVDPFNDAGLPTRILKYARLGRATISPELAGARTWSRATQFAIDAGEFAGLLRRSAGLRNTPDAELRDWALAQTSAAMNVPLHARLAE